MRGTLLGELGRFEEASRALQRADEHAKNAHERAQIRSRTQQLEASAAPMKRKTAEELFWELALQLSAEDPRVVEGTIMNGRCLRVGKEFLALVDYKGSGLVVKLSRARVVELIDSGVGQPFAPTGRVFKEWLSVPKPDHRRWLEFLREGIAFVA